MPNQSAAYINSQPNPPLANTGTGAAGTVTGTERAAITHANRALLDTYTQTEANLSDAVAKKHVHANQAVLDAAFTPQRATASLAAPSNIGTTLTDILSLAVTAGGTWVVIGKLRVGPTSNPTFGYNAIGQLYSNVAAAAIDWGDAMIAKGQDASSYAAIPFGPVEVAGGTTVTIRVEIGNNGAVTQAHIGTRLYAYRVA